MRILHTSDWHIGRQFHHVSLLEDQRFVLEQVIAIAKSEAVDVVLIAGDIYDRAIPPTDAVNLVDDVLNRLCNDLGVPVVIIAGNHDSPERLGFASRHLAKASLHVAGSLTKKGQTVTLNDKYGEVVFYQIPYADPATVRDVFPDIDTEELRSHDQCMTQIIQQIPEHKDQRSVLLSHCFLAGGSNCDSERPLVGGAEQVSYKHFSDFNYVALGHLHRSQKCGAKTIRYSGSVLKYSFSEESHDKSVTLVDMDAKGDCKIRQVELNTLRNMRSITGNLDEVIAEAKNDPHRDDYLLVNLKDTHAILYPMGKIRAVYPNVLHLVPIGLMANSPKKLKHRDLLKKGELFMFEDFYKQMQGEDLSKTQKDVLENLLDEIHSAREL